MANVPSEMGTSPGKGIEKGDATQIRAATMAVKTIARMFNFLFSFISFIVSLSFFSLFF